ncbi:MAG: hypothetical protein LBR06_04540 [Bacteroidales bacterium]|jgi:hypothetical protein|nr:hypothetical protein [Bacteroidales bacterium]
MENTTQISLNQEGVSQLRKLGVWTKILAVTQFISCGISFIIGLLVLLFGSSGAMFSSEMGEMTGLFRTGGVVAAVGAVVMIFTAIMLIPALYLFRFSGQAKAVALQRTPALEESFKYLKLHFKSTGIIIVAGIAFTIVATVVALIAVAIFFTNSQNSIS